MQRFTVVFCARTESNRQWSLAEPAFPHRFLQPRARALADGYNHVHDNRDVWRVLTTLRPQVVVTTGFNPTHLYAFAWTRLHGAKHVPMTDGTLASEAGLSWRHRALRRFVYRGSSAFVAASRGGIDLYRSYGIPPDAIFRSHLCADNPRFAAAALPLHLRDFDVIFVGQLHELKRPLFFAKICGALLRARGRCRALVVGDGPMKVEMLGALESTGVSFHYAGFVQPDALPAWYGRARVLLFPTRLDAWGVVANEAMAAGTPVIVSPAAGVADDLVIDGTTGIVRVPEVAAWVEAVQPLLDDDARWLAMSAAARAHVAAFNFDAAAQGLVSACDHALRRGRR